MSLMLNIPRAERLLEEAGVDVLVGSSHANVFYLSGFEGFSQRVITATEVYAITRADGLEQPILVAPLGDLDMHAQFPPPVAAVRSYGGFVVETSDEPLDGPSARYAALAELPRDGSAREALLDELAKLPAGSRIAIDEGGMPPALWDEVRATYGERVVAGSSLLRAIRMVKTPEEVRRLEAAALAIESSYEAALAAAHEGMTEAEMSVAFNRRTVEQGAEPYFTVLAFGERGALPNAISSAERRLKPGDTIRFDIGCKLDFYASDIARTAVFGEPSEKLSTYYGAIQAGEEAMIELMRPGVTGRELFDAAVQATRENGIPHYRRHHVGHGIGLDAYDAPMLAPGDETPLEPGMVFEVETPYYELGFAGLQVEDTLVVTEDGRRVLTQGQRSLRVLPA